jgi:hypothetical protein
VTAADPLALKYEGPLRATIAKRHRTALNKPVPLPGPNGAFLPTLLPWVFPLVLDTHALGRDLGRRARCGRTVLVSGAISGVLRLFAPRHVASEMLEYMDEWADLGQCSMDQVATLWYTEYLPLLRVVDVPGGLLYPDEADRVEILATEGDPLGDPDDVPTAILGLLLDAPVLSQDGKLLKAVYGHDFDCAAHGEWLEALRAGGDLGPLGDFVNAGYMLTASAALGTCSLGAKMVEFFGWPVALLLVGAGALGFHFLASPETKAKVGRGIKTAATESWELLQALAVTYGQARAEIEALAPGSDPYRGGYATGGVLRRKCLHTVARARSGHVSAEQLSDMLTPLDVPHGEKKVREVLRTTRAFEEVSRGRFQVGRAHIRQTALPSPQAAR